MDNSYCIYKSEFTIFDPPPHDHLLGIHEENDLDLDQGTNFLCAACTLPIFSTPYERNEAGRYLHKCCAKLPRVLMDHPLHINEPLYLHKRYLLCESIGIFCLKCESECKGFFYQCKDSDCRFALDVLCAGITVKLLHRSHTHELVLIRSKALSASCEACESKVEGESYWCSLCDFYIHPKCASLPSSIRHIKHEHHALTLLYHYSSDFMKFKKSSLCSLCHQGVSRRGTYICTRCDWGIHVKCVISDPGSFKAMSSQDVVGGLIRLPMETQEISVMQYILEKYNITATTKQDKTKTIGKMHHHPLIFHNAYGDQGSSQSSTYLCDACVQPISSSFYSCPRCDDFYLHDCCANLSLQNQQLGHNLTHYSYVDDLCQYCDDTHLSLHSRYSKSLARFMCSGCRKYCNGSVLECKRCEFQVDMECAFLPDIISHNTHGKSHILFLSYIDFRITESVCRCCTSTIEGLMYQCGSCPNFMLHAQCAVLPLSIENKLDRHALSLATSTISTSDDYRNFCEICEEGINTKSWLYECKECVTLFHIKCIPCVAKFSKLKFGYSIRVSCHDCPLTSIRLLTSYSYTCGLCKKTIHGRVDGTALECTKCGYWLHSDCAAET